MTQQAKRGIHYKECFANIWAVRKFTKYLDGCHFTVFTDHHSLCQLFGKQDPQGKLTRWAVMLQEYDFNKNFKEGRCHADVDFLTRLPSLHSELSVSFVELKILQEEQQKDGQTGKITRSDTMTHGNGWHFPLR